jgi:hypothetical protein
MKSAWTILLISAFTDFIITFAVGLQVGNAASATAYPSGPTLLYSAIGGVVVAARTIQQALKATSADAAALRGIEVVSITKMPGKTEIAGTPDPGQIERSAQNVREPAP